MNDRQQWLASLKMGDEVVYMRGYRYTAGDGELFKITRMTKTRFVFEIPNGTGSPVEYWVNRETGNGPYDRYSGRHSISPVTPEYREAIRRKVAIRAIDNAVNNRSRCFTHIKTENLERIAAMLEGDA